MSRYGFPFPLHVLLSFFQGTGTDVTATQLVVYKAAETKRYDFEARNADEAAEIVSELKKGIAPYNRDV